MIALTDEPLDLAALLAAVADPEHGGIGDLHRHHPARGAASARSRRCDYEAYEELALAELRGHRRRGARGASAPRVAVAHRVGRGGRGRAERRRRGVGRPPPRGLRRLPLRHRRAQGARPDLEADASTPTATRPGSTAAPPRAHAHAPSRERRTMPEQPRPGIGVDDPLIAPAAPRPRRGRSTIDEELWTDDSGEDYSGWYCVRTDPWNCPATGCSFVAQLPHRGPPRHRLARDGRPGPAAPRGRRPRRGPQPAARRLRARLRARLLLLPVGGGRQPGARRARRHAAGTSTRRGRPPRVFGATAPIRRV